MLLLSLVLPPGVPGLTLASLTCTSAVVTATSVSICLKSVGWLKGERSGTATHGSVTVVTNARSHLVTDCTLTGAVAISEPSGFRAAVSVGLYYRCEGSRVAAVSAGAGPTLPMLGGHPNLVGHSPVSGLVARPGSHMSPVDWAGKVGIGSDGSVSLAMAVVSVILLALTICVLYALVV